MLAWLSTQTPMLVYVFLVFNAMLESFFPPYPSDAFVVVIAFSAGQGHFSPYAVYGATCIGSVAGIMMIYFIAKCKGAAVIHFLTHSFLKKILPVKMVERAMRKFSQHDDVIILLNRFLPGMRAAICFAAGLAQIKTHPVFLYSLISVLIWNLFLVMVGFHVGSSWHEASAFLRNYNIIVAVALIVLLTIFSFVYFRKKRRFD